MLDRAELENTVERLLATGRVPGLVLAAVHGDDLVYAGGFGLANAETGQRATPGTLFRVGSLTKGLTATMILRLVEAGVLDLDRPVRDYVPWIAFSDPAAAGQITLRRLLSHSAGLPTAHSPFGRRDPEALAAYVRGDVAGYRFIAPPGKLYDYSNGGVRVAGYVAEAVTGRPYAELMRELVFLPLDMARTTFDPTVAMTYPLAQAHDLLAGGAWQVRHRYPDDAAGYPSGFAISTVLDMANYARMQIGRGQFRGRAILSPGSVAEMQRCQIPLYTVTDAGYGLGLQVDTYKGLARVSHDGSIGNFGSRLVMVPGTRAAVILAVNRATGFWRQIEQIADTVIDQLLDLGGGPAALPSPVAPDRSAWPRYTGAYLGDWAGLAEVRAAGDRLELAWNGTAVPLHAYKDNVYFGQKPGSGETVSLGFVPEAAGPVQYVLVNSSACARFTPDPAFAPDPAALAAYPGTYYLFGEDRLTFRLDGDRLLVHSEDQGREMACVPIGRHRFAADRGLLDFELGSGGAVAAVRMGQVYTLPRLA